MFTFAVLTDLHLAHSAATWPHEAAYEAGSAASLSDALRPESEKRSDIADILLQRAVHRLNRVVRPDFVVVLGDLIDDPSAPDALEQLRRIESILGTLEAPYLALPGNHDPEPELFYQVFERPEPIVDHGRVRFVPFFDDPFTDDAQAYRPEAYLERLTTARNGHDGPIVVLQHVPVLPSWQTESRFNYVNADAIVEALEENRITLSISGHEHRGTTPLLHHGCTYAVAPALCKPPFPITVVRVSEAGDVQIDAEPLQMPRKLQLVDWHSHTEFAYCGDDAAMQASVALAHEFGLAGLGLTEHTGQLYYDRPTFWSGRFAAVGSAAGVERELRTPDYWVATDAIRREGVMIGFEVDADFDGNPVLDPEDRERAEILVGGLHFLPETVRAKEEGTPASLDRLTEEFLGVMERFVPSGIHILAHPFRIFQRAGHEAPEKVYEPLIKLLRTHGVAAEINFHKNRPEPEFFYRCLEQGVKLSFGGDAHSRFQVGELAQHLRFLRDELDFDGELADVLLQPSGVGVEAR